MIDDIDPAPRAVERTAATRATLQSDLADLREGLATGRSNGLSVDTLAELEEALCRLMSELNAADEPGNQNGSTHG